MDQLTLLSTHSKKENKLQQQIRNAGVILEAFGHARTTQTRSASKFGMFQELQFSERGRILGAKTLTYAFDKARLTKVPLNERTYHVFYALLAGTTVDEKNALHINFGFDYFHYLNQSRCITVADRNDDIAFGDLKSALKVCGFKAKTVTQIFQLLAAILHLGNLEFQDTRGGEVAEETCTVKNEKVLEIVSAMLGVSPSKLETALTYKLRLIRNELCTAFMNAQGATEQRDSLAQALYHVLFLWIVESINTKICYSDGDPANFIGILDQFGFQNFKENGFEEFSANFANERIHQFLIYQRFNDDASLNALMVRDNVPLPRILTMDNAGCLDLLVGKERDTTSTKVVQKSAALGLGGVVGLMDRDCARYQTGATDATDANMLANLQRQFAGHSSFSKSTQTYSFGINHFSGTVHYTVDGFVEKNLNTLSPDFVTLLRDNSSNAFVATLFSSTAMATESHPKDGRTIVKAQLSSKPTRAPSMRRRPTNKRRGAAAAATGAPDEADTGEPDPSKEAEQAYQDMQVMTVMDQLYVTLRDLCTTMADTRIYNIIHLRPNDMQTADMVDMKRLKSQVRAFLLPDLVQRSGLEYANHYAFAEFLMRYDRLVVSLQIDGSKSERSMVESVCAIMNWTEQQAYIGNDNIWLAFDVWKELEDSLRAAEKEERARMKAAMSENNNTDVMSDAPGGVGAMDPHFDPHYEESNDRLLPPGGAYLDPQHPPAHMARASVFDDNGSYYESDFGMKREAEGSQWGEESEWGMKGLSEG